MFKKIFAGKSPFRVVITTIVALFAVLILIPQTRSKVVDFLIKPSMSDVVALMLKPSVYIYQPTLLNQPIPLQPKVAEWKLKTMSNDTCIMASMLDKVTVVNYWATWCPPCVAEIGQFESLYRDYGEKVNFLFISNELYPEISKFVDRKKLKIPIYLPITDYPSQLSTKVLPTTFIFDAQGNIVMRKEGIAQWNGAKMRNILDALISKK